MRRIAIINQKGGSRFLAILGAIIVGVALFAIASTIKQNTKLKPDSLQHAQAIPITEKRVEQWIVHVLEKPNTGALALKTLEQGDTVKVDAKLGDWFRVPLPEDSTNGFGWINGYAFHREKVVSKPEKVVSELERSTGGAIYAKVAANIRSGPSTSHPVVAKASPGERLIYEAKEDNWYKLRGGDDGEPNWISATVVMTESEQHSQDRMSVLRQQMRDRIPLRMTDWHWGHQRDYAVAEGVVQNVSSRRLESVMAVVLFYTASGEFITSEDALIKYDPLMPGQSSPWEVMARWNPQMAKASVEFKKLFGEELDYREK